MMRLVQVLSVLFVLHLGLGCQSIKHAGPSPPSIPAASDVSSIHLTSLGSSLGPEYDVTLTKEPDIEALLAWLNQVDWSPSQAQDLQGVALASVGNISITKKDNTGLSFGLSGGSIIAGRWEWHAETDELASIAEQAGAKVLDESR